VSGSEPAYAKEAGKIEASAANLKTLIFIKYTF
jgi:hypothetical protein